MTLARATRPITLPMIMTLPRAYHSSAPEDPMTLARAKSKIHGFSGYQASPYGRNKPQTLDKPSIWRPTRDENPSRRAISRYPRRGMVLMTGMTLSRADHDASPCNLGRYPMRILTLPHAKHPCFVLKLSGTYPYPYRGEGEGVGVSLMLHPTTPLAVTMSRGA